MCQLCISICSMTDPSVTMLLVSCQIIFSRKSKIQLKPDQQYRYETIFVNCYVKQDFIKKNFYKIQLQYIESFVTLYVNNLKSNRFLRDMDHIIWLIYLRIWIFHLSVLQWIIAIFFFTIGVQSCAAMGSVNLK